jgi:flagellar biosynthesis regulator FlaF
MTTELQASQKNLYESDFVRWVETTVKQLRAQDYTNVDWTNLIEEIEDMSKRERKGLKSNLIVLLLHLLKWQYQSEFRSGSWRGSIREHRRRINDDLKDSPSLKSYLEEISAECYTNAREQAADETGLPLETFPVDCLYTFDRVLDPNFLPESKD